MNNFCLKTATAADLPVKDIVVLICGTDQIYIENRPLVLICGTDQIYIENRPFLWHNARGLFEIG